MKTPRQRKLVRLIHLIGAGAIGTYVYAPWKDIQLFTLLMQVVVLPGLTLTGLWLWLGPSIRRVNLDKLLTVKTQRVVDGKIQSTKTPGH
jgi:hypothetical protein